MKQIIDYLGITALCIVMASIGVLMAVAATFIGLLYVAVCVIEWVTA